MADEAARAGALADEVDRSPGPTHLIQEVVDELSVIVVALDGPEHRLVATNAASRARAGQQHLLGRPLREIVPPLVPAGVVDLCDQVLASGLPVRMLAWRAGSAADGDQLRDVVVDVESIPRFAADGTVRGVVCTFVDVTAAVRQRERHRTEISEAEQRYRAARDVVAELQEALHPAEVPVLPGVRIAARYLVAAPGQSAGGDWFDAIPLPSGAVALVVGDIVGHGAAASAAMGQLRAVLHELLTETGDLSATLTRIDRMAARTPGMFASTVVIAVLDPPTGRLRYCTAGHPPPLVVGIDGATRYLPPSGAGPLGTASSLVTAVTTIAPGELVVCYTDGLLERHGHSLTEGLTRLARVASAAVTHRAGPAAAGSVADRVCRDCVGIVGPAGSDDVTVLAAQRRARPLTTWHACVPATVDRLAPLRAGLATWLDDVDPAPQDRSCIDLAVAELLANAVEHGYPAGRPGPVSLRAAVDTDGVLVLTVTDHGTWRQPAADPPAVSGRGLWIAGALVDDLTIAHPATGTAVTLRHRLHHPAQRPAGRSGRGLLIATNALVMVLEHGPPRTLYVAGPVDISTAAAFADRLDTAGRGGLHALVVDLTAVDALSSAGVRVLFSARDRHGVHGTALTLVTTRSSVPAHVLDLVGLRHVSHPAGATPVPR